MQAWTISNLAHVPHFADTVADRGWHAWWQKDGISLADYRDGLDPIMSGAGFPAAFVAHRNKTYLGSVLLIENDLEIRPDLNPWVAALWVEEAERQQGIAADLMNKARVVAAALGYPTVYLCAEPQIGGFYVTRGWKLIETGVGGLDVFKIATG